MKFSPRIAVALALSLLANCLVALPNANATTFFSGQVVDTQLQPIQGVTIEAGHIDFGGLFGGFVADGTATTDAQGNYAITSLDSLNTSDQYTLVAQLPGYVLTVYPNVHCFDAGCLSFSQATYAPSLGDANFTLSKAASIAGTVTRTDTNAGAQMQVELDSAQGYFLTYADCDEKGEYKIEGLPAGVYTAWVHPANSGVDTLLNQVYADHDYDDTRAVSPDLIALQEGQSAAGIDFHLQPGATITGAFTSAIDGAPVMAVIELERTDPDANPGYYIVGGARGTYQSQLLAPGSFFVQFVNGDDYLPLFYSQASSESQAQQVTLSYGQQLAGIDAQLTPTRTVAGRVTDAVSSQPIQGIGVHAIKVSCLAFCLANDVADAVSNSSGDYLLQGLDSDADGYYIWAEGAVGSGYICQDYPDLRPCSSNPTSATKVPLGDSEHKAGVDFSLHKGSYASGRVSDPLTGNISGSWATLIDADKNVIGYANGSDNADGQLSDAGGQYMTPAVPPGKYYISITSPIGTILYPNVICGFGACDFSQAQLVDMSAAKEYPNMDFVIPHLDLIFQDGL